MRRTQHLYIVRYCQSGYTDGIEIYTTLKEAKIAAHTAINKWNAYKATVFVMEHEPQNYKYRFTSGIYNYFNDKNK